MIYIYVQKYHISCDLKLSFGLGSGMHIDVIYIGLRRNGVF